jgi:hypothetical protein
MLFIRWTLGCVHRFFYGKTVRGSVRFRALPLIFFCKLLKKQFIMIEMMVNLKYVEIQILIESLCSKIANLEDELAELKKTKKNYQDENVFLLKKLNLMEKLNSLLWEYMTFIRIELDKRELAETAIERIISFTKAFYETHESIILKNASKKKS